MSPLTYLPEAEDRASCTVDVSLVVVDVMIGSLY
jgi:hypothetical protein